MIYGLFSVLLAIVPAVLLIFFIVGKDKKQPEPPGQLVKAFFYGVLSVFVTFAFHKVIDLFIYVGDATVGDMINRAFWEAAIPEEMSKLLMLWLLLRKNKYFDEHFDGIVYAVMIGLGFATVENLLYMADNYDRWAWVGTVRALLSVPGHYVFAVLMGYYYSLAQFSPRKRVFYWIMALFVPILLHGLYDALLMVVEVVPMFLGLLSIVLCIVLCYYMHKEAFRRINKHLQADSIIVPEVSETSHTPSQDDIEYVDYEETKQDE
ncbi:MAG: PrsW family intramembrane metalloprotease [Bacteroidaceae bacterium]|nr:PrsW family intramembrane metalloprotease [Bacteroidaceae bacterium]